MNMPLETQRPGLPPILYVKFENVFSFPFTNPDSKQQILTGPFMLDPVFMIIVFSDVIL